MKRYTLKYIANLVWVVPVMAVYELSRCVGFCCVALLHGVDHAEGYWRLTE